jgi:hypothetical protein
MFEFEMPKRHLDFVVTPANCESYIFDPRDLVVYWFRCAVTTDMPNAMQAEISLVLIA